VFGDSFSTAHVCVSPKESFWGLVAQDLEVNKIQNYSHPGFSLDHVLHILLNETFDFSTDYFVIGIPALIRYVGYSDSYNTTWNLSEFDKDFVQKSQTINCLSNTQKFKFEHQFNNNVIGVDRFNTEWNNVQCLEKIFLLHQYLKSQNAKFMIVNLSLPVWYQDLWPAGCNIMIRVKQLPECIIFDNTLYSVNHNDKIKPADFDLGGWLDDWEQQKPGGTMGWQGHHGQEGNVNWYNKVIKPKMIELNWIKNA
jgi:hypothetical protein